MKKSSCTVSEQEMHERNFDVAVCTLIAGIVFAFICLAGCPAGAQDALTIETAGGAVYSKVIYDWTSAADGTATGRTTAVIPGIMFGVALSPSLTAWCRPRG